MSLTVWLSLLGACAVISLTPGAGAVNTMSTSLLYGWAKSAWTILGQQAALVVQILIVAAGLGVIVANSPIVFDIIRFAGAAYLVYLGVRMMASRPARTAAAAGGAHPSAGATETRARSAWALVRQGFWVNMSNPKAIVFILAFTPQFIRSEHPLLTQYAVLMITMVCIDIIVMWGGFAAIARSLTAFSGTPHGERILNTIFGALFIFVAGLLVFIGH